MIKFGASSGAPKFAQTASNQFDFFIEGVFTTQFSAQSQIVSALHVIVNGVYVVKTEVAPFADQTHF